MFTSNEYLQTYDVSSGVEYTFKVRAKNKHGWGEFSQTVTILAAVVPDASLVTSTVQSGTSVILAWDLPVEHGAAVN